MSGWTERTRTVLVMWEYGCAFSPLWSRSEDLDVGPVDAAALGLSGALRSDLADWNERCETAADPSDVLPVPVGAAAWRAAGAEAFLLAARVQRGLGDAWTVWCCAGGGDGALTEPEAFSYTRAVDGPQLVLRDRGLVEWSPTGALPGADRVDRASRDAVRRWAAERGRLPPAEHRARALALGARLHRALPEGRVLWFGGGDVPV